MHNRLLAERLAKLEVDRQNMSDNAAHGTVAKAKRGLKAEA